MTFAVDMDRPVVADLVAEVAMAVSRRAAEVSEDVYKLILQEIPQLDDDKPLVALLASSVDSNVGTCLQIMLHRIDLAAVRAPASAVEYARRLAQRGTPLTMLLRAYRLGHACFSDWLLTELALLTELKGRAGDAATGSPPRVVTYSEVAPVAMMLGSTNLLRAWVLGTLAGLAIDDEHHARLRDTLLVFLHTGGSYKTTAERLVLHKNTVQYRIRKAEESLGQPVGENRHDVELALRASHWLGSSVLLT
jgi:DNA-binding PucR family transcriptional regulator